MLGANLASAGIWVLFAAEPTPAFDVKNLEQILPYAIGGVFAFGVVIVGLLMSRRNSAAAQPVVDGVEDQLPPIYKAPNQLWSLVLPSVIVLGIGGGIVCFVIPLFQEVSKGAEDFQATLRANHAAAIQSVLNSDVKFPMGPAVEFKPIQLPPQPQIQIPQFVPPPQIHIPHFQPPPPHIPHIYVDRQGFIHSR
jgi:hypothetical protein